MRDRWPIMIASSNWENRRGLLRILDRQGIDPICASTVTQCRDILGRENVGLVFCDRFFADGDYRDVLSAAACGSRGVRTRVVLMSDLIDSEQYEKAKQQGIFEVISASCRPTDVEWMIIQAKRDEQKQANSFVSAESASVGRG
jgi:DNA-binding NtrC family response regulator